MEITLPQAYDGDDMQIHLIHEVVLPVSDSESPEEPKEENEEESDDDSALPSIGVVAVLAITMFAAVIGQRKQQ